MRRDPSVSQPSLGRWLRTVARWAVYALLVALGWVILGILFLLLGGANGF